MILLKSSSLDRLLILSKRGGFSSASVDVKLVVGGSGTV